LAYARRAAQRVGLLPFRRLRDAAADPQREEAGQDADEVHVAPAVGPELADEHPDERGDEEADAQAALHEAGAFAARAIGPELGDDRGAGGPFGADGDADDEPQHGERFPAP